MYNLVNYFTSKLIEHNVKGLTYIPWTITIWNRSFSIQWSLDKLALTLQQDVDFYTACKLLNELIN